MTSALKWGWVISTTPRHFTPGKDPVPIVQEVEYAPGPVWMGAKNLAPHRDPIQLCESIKCIEFSCAGESSASSQSWQGCICIKTEEIIHLFLTHKLQDSLDKWLARSEASAWDNTTYEDTGQHSWPKRDSNSDLCKQAVKIFASDHIVTGAGINVIYCQLKLLPAYIHFRCDFCPQFRTCGCPSRALRKWHFILPGTSELASDHIGGGSDLSCALSFKKHCSFLPAWRTSSLPTTIYAQLYMTYVHAHIPR